MSNKKITIALDGFSSSGKSSMAKWLAKQIGYIYADSGAMYRAVTLFCLQNGLINNDIVDEEGLKTQIGNIHISFATNAESGGQETYLNGQKVEKEIRTLLISNYVSPVSAIKFVRQAMVRQQQEMGQKKGIVMDGRDIGTVVFPDAKLKIFVTATPEIRAERRFLEMQEKGEPVAYEDILENVKKRDYIDQNRAESPLRKADDAIVLDNSRLTIEEQREWLLKQFEERTR
jgi:cytidylate kinase